MGSPGDSYATVTSSDATVPEVTLFDAIFTEPLSESNFKRYGIDLSDVRTAPLMQWHYPFLIGLAYLAVVLAINPRDNSKRRRAGPILKGMGVFYNITMTFFSYRVFTSTFPLVLGKWNSGGTVVDILCDLMNESWEAAGFCSWLFYVSKYYEFFDTIQIVGRRRRVIFLQYYHHAGAVLTMWGLVYTRAGPALLYTTFNALIHTIMYFYYLITGLGVKVPFMVKMSITVCQITQFVFALIGMAMSLNASDRLNDGQTAMLVFTGFYVVVLVGLFAKFMGGEVLAKPRKQISSKSTKVQ